MIRYFQLLDSCNGDLASCCNDYALSIVLSILQKILSIIQIAVPIILMTMLTIQLVKMVIAPDQKNILKSILNKIAAAVICFFLPIIVDLVLMIIPQSGIVSSTFQVSACWESAKKAKGEIDSSTYKYVTISSPGSKNYAISRNIANRKSNNSNSTFKGSNTGRAIVTTAFKYVPGRYCWGGKNPNVCADCSGFVQYVFGQHGYSLPGSTTAYNINSSMFTIVSPNDIRAGDIVLYNGHVAILTGNGNQIVHAATEKLGITIASTYQYQPVRAILRVKGVN